MSARGLRDAMNSHFERGYSDRLRSTIPPNSGAIAHRDAKYFGWAYHAGVMAADQRLNQANVERRLDTAVLREALDAVSGSLEAITEAFVIAAPEEAAEFLRALKASK